jgi:lysophospholipase L1-like esterase
MRHDGIEFHGVGELVPDGGGVLLQRVPEDVRTELNEGARQRYRQPAGVEMRFETGAPAIDVTLSAPEGNRVVPYWGPFRSGTTHRIGTDPTTIRVRRPDRVRELPPGAVDAAFAPRCWRLRFDPLQGPIRYHGVDAPVEPPAADTTPDRRYLAYGTSITQGTDATGPHLTCVAQTARRLGVDPVNLGTGGSAYCERAIADHVASLDWDVATLALSVNMLNAGFDVDVFRERARYLVETAASTGRPVAAITLYPHYHDFGDAAADAEAYRDALREVVDGAPENATLIEGPDLLDPAGLTGDLIHPGDDGMIGIGERLAARIDPLLDGDDSRRGRVRG